MQNGEPYLTVVATTRNDDHGGNLLRRTQIFVTGFIEQCRRHSLEAELILVEWNPPPDRPRLTEALSWPEDKGPCQVRIIEVPPEIHNRFKYSDRLPLFQMIAKNVGIRRSRGRFVLATNIDILFSDELMEFLANNSLEPDKCYRIDRSDVSADVPLSAPIEEQIDFCKRNLLRVNTKNGTFDAIEAPDRADRSTDNLPRQTNNSLALRQWAILPFAVLFLSSLRMKQRAKLPVPEELKNPKYYQEYWPALREIIPAFSILQWMFLPLIPMFRILLKNLWGLPLPTKFLLIPYYRQFWGPLRELLNLFYLPRLHTNGCGDFTLMSKESWFSLRGYAELEMYSFHLDSLLCWAAYYHGVKEEVLKEPMRIYHIEHAAGSGWTPGGEVKLFNRIDVAGIPRLSDEQLWEYVQSMDRKRQPIIFGNGNWGIAEKSLPETTIT